MVCHVNVNLVGGFQICRQHLLQKGETHTPKGYAEYVTKSDPMMKLQFLTFVDCGIPLHCHYSLVHSDLEW